MTGDHEGPIESMSYTEASRELDEIVAFFDQREVDVDQLVSRLERATAIVDELDRRLRRTRVQVDELVPKLQAVASGADREDDTDDGAELDRADELAEELEDAVAREGEDPESPGLF